MTVEQIQAALNAHGYHLAVDGVRGPKTNAAIRDFQAKHGLAVDGIVGAKTTAALGGGSGRRTIERTSGPGTGGSDSSSDMLRWVSGGGTLSIAQAKGLLLAQGASASEASLLAAIMVPESGGKVGAVNSTGNRNGTRDYGLWQINSIWTTDGLGRYSSGSYDPVKLRTDPAYNARAALNILRQEGPGMWSTYNQGEHKPYLHGAATTRATAAQGAQVIRGYATSHAAASRTRPAQAWGNPDTAGYSQQNIVTVTAAGHRFQVNRAYSTQFVGFVNALAAQGYQIRSVLGYSNRNIAGTSKKSNHAYGAAIDINPTANAVNSRGNMPPNVVDLARAYGLGWGGEWKSKKDPMHFEVIGAPSSATYDGRGPGSTAPRGPVDLGQYEWVRALAASDPSLARWLRDYTTQGWDPATAKAELYDTDFFRRHSVSQRSMNALRTSDPAEYERRRQLMAQQARQMMQRLGVNMPESAFSQFVTLALDGGWQPDEQQRYLSNYFRINTPGSLHGDAATTIRTLKDMAAAYVVPISDATLQDWTRQVLAGTTTPEAFRQTMVDQAKRLYPQFADALDQGITTNTYLDPYRQAAANELEVSPAEVDFSQPKWRAPLTFRDEKGKASQMPLDDWQRKLRSDPAYGWDTTAGAREKGAEFATALMTQFGYTGPTANMGA